MYPPDLTSLQTLSACGRMETILLPAPQHPCSGALLSHLQLHNGSVGAPVGACTLGSGSLSKPGTCRLCPS